MIVLKKIGEKKLIMVLEQKNVYMIHTRAMALSHVSYPRGEKHAILVFSSHSIDDAPDLKLIRETLHKNGWGELEIVRYKKIDDLQVKTSEMEETLRASYLSAKKNGISIIVYQDPI